MMMMTYAPDMSPARVFQKIHDWNVHRLHMLQLVACFHLICRSSFLADGRGPFHDYFQHFVQPMESRSVPTCPLSHSMADWLRSTPRRWLLNEDASRATLIHPLNSLPLVPRQSSSRKITRRPQNLLVGVPLLSRGPLRGVDGFLRASSPKIRFPRPVPRIDTNNTTCRVKFEKQQKPGE
jgi:hypothetical protein